MTQLSIGVAIALAAASACSSKTEQAPGTGSVTPPAAPPATGSAVGASSSDGGVAPGDAETLKQHMDDHFTAVSELQRAIVRGDLAGVKQKAQWIATHEEAQQLEARKPFVADMKQAARAIEVAADLPTAATLAATLARTCSRCHEQLAAPVSFAWDEVPPAGPELVVQMKRHQWATARLWEGLVGPSDTMWAEGATVLASFQLDAVAAGSAKNLEIATFAARARELAGRAVKTLQLDERSAVYGELLATCAGCHAVARPAPVPGP